MSAKMPPQVCGIGMEASTLLPDPDSESFASAGNNILPRPNGEASPTFNRDPSQGQRNESESSTSRQHGHISVGPANATTLTPESKVKCVLVGDGAVGKTSLIVSFFYNLHRILKLHILQILNC